MIGSRLGMISSIMQFLKDPSPYRVKRSAQATEVVEEDTEVPDPGIKDEEVEAPSYTEQVSY